MVESVNGLLHQYLNGSHMKSEMTILDPFSIGMESAYYDLRWRVLRKPWDQPRGTERDELESDSIHRVVVNEEGSILACARLQLNSPEEAQLRYMAVEPEARRSGVGRMLLHAMEEIATSAGAERMMLQAREGAVPFYAECGYSIVQETFVLYGTIRHFLMEKVLDQSQGI